jgi:hypothetical protein
MSFVRYTPEDSVVSVETVVRPMWSGNTNLLTTFYTSTVITSSFYLNVYAEAPGSSLSTSASVQFAVQYGNKYGSGSAYINSSVTTQLPDSSSITPTRVVYGQYRTLLLGTESGSFTFGSDNPNGIYIINIARNRYKEHIQPGSLTLNLSNGGNVISLTDDSQISSTTNYTTNGLLYYTLISGSGGIQSSNVAVNASIYGYLFPDNDIMVLNPTALSKSAANGGIGFNPTVQTPGADNDVDGAFYNTITAGAYFALQSAENVAAHYFFTRVKNQDFNYTTNPSIIDNNGNLIYSTLINNPQTFITTVGLYNNQNELLAVAKLSRPLVKDFTKEALIKVKLDY